MLSEGICKTLNAIFVIASAWSRCKLTAELDPYFYIPRNVLLKGTLEKLVPSTAGDFWVGKLTAGGKSTERVLVFESSGSLTNLVRIEVSALGKSLLLPFLHQLHSIWLTAFHRCMVRRRREASRTSSQRSVQTHRDDPFFSGDSNRGWWANRCEKHTECVPLWDNVENEVLFGHHGSWMEVLEWDWDYKLLSIQRDGQVSRCFPRQSDRCW